MLPTGHIRRLVEQALNDALQDSPVVLIHGPRQSGKTTLASHIGAAKGYAYFSLDDDTLREAAAADPKGFIEDLPDRVIVDEIQRLPQLFSSIKLVVDRDRQPGRFLLTGSSNVFLLPKLADSLAGRMATIRLHPLARSEIAGITPWFIDSIFSQQMRSSPVARLGKNLAEYVVAGGYPAALARSDPRRREAWYRDFVDALVQRDVRELSRISSLDALPRLLTVAASQTARLLNVSDLASPFQVSRQTIRDYLTLLEQVFLVEEQRPWHANHLTRLVKSAKLQIGDTGLAAALLELDAEGIRSDRQVYGQLVETFVYQELRRQESGRNPSAGFLHYRDRDQYEVDIIIQRRNLLAGVEIKASSTVTEGDFRGLRRLARSTGTRFAAGAVLYDGEHTLSFGDRLYAVPIASLWHEN
ncbi:MAG: ATP-binding protein [Trueperaceae bacterium]|nr:ATP-binding protein [Trueperaceae bacterium]